VTASCKVIATRTIVTDRKFIEWSISQIPELLDSNYVVREALIAHFLTAVMNALFFVCKLHIAPIIRSVISSPYSYLVKRNYENFLSENGENAGFTNDFNKEKHIQREKDCEYLT
jgi:hypothetical protein